MRKAEDRVRQPPSFPPKLPQRMVFKNIGQKTTQVSLWGTGQVLHRTAQQPDRAPSFNPNKAAPALWYWTESDNLKVKVPTEKSNTGATTIIPFV